MSSTDDGYDLIAEKFEFTPFRTPEFILNDVGAQLGHPERGLDVCCGTGAGSRMLKQHCQQVTGIDRSEGMLAEARRLAVGSPGAGVCTYVQGDALNMPFESEFDVAVCFGAFGHILDEDLPLFLRNIHDALKPGGRFIFVTVNPPGLGRRAFWLAHGFNAAMRVRNAVWKPQFIMYYLNFLLPRATALCRNAGFEVQVIDNAVRHPRARVKLVIATRRA
jgi:ubiquinone/menaquinone biosynthesis C-methylase UbiE